MAMSAEKDIFEERTAAVACITNENNRREETPNGSEGSVGQTKPRVMEAILKGARACEDLGLYKEAIVWCEDGLAIDQQHRDLKELWTKCVQKEMKSLNITEDNATGTGYRPTTTGPVKPNGNLRQISEGEEEKTDSEVANAVDHSVSRLHEAREIFQQIGDRVKERLACRSLSSVLYSLRNFKEALQYEDVCLEIAKEQKDTNAEGQAHSYIGLTYHHLYEFRLAIEHHKQHLSIAKKLRDKKGEGDAYCNLGAAYKETSQFKHAIECFKSYLDISKELGDKRMEGQAYRNLGMAYRSIGNLSLALHIFNLHLSIAKTTGNKFEEGAVYGNLGNTYYNLGDLTKAKEYYTLHLELVRKVGDKLEEGEAYTKLGILYCRIGHFKKALGLLEMGLSVSQEVRNKAGLGMAYNGLGMCYDGLGEFKKATEYHTMHLRIAKELDDKAGEGYAYGNLGILFFRLGDPQQAIQYHTSCLDVTKEIGDRYGEGQACSNLGNAHCFLGAFNTGIKYHQAHLTITKEVKDRAGEGDAYTNLGIAYYGLCDFKTAIECHEDALSIATEVGNPVRQGGAYCSLGNCYLSLGDFKKAITFQNLYRTIAVKVNDKVGEGNAYCNIGYAYFRDGDLRSADRYLNMALEIAVQIGDKALEGRVHANLGNCSSQLGDFLEAITHHQRSLSIAKEVGDRDGEARAYGNLGANFQRIKDHKKALAFFKEDLKIAKEIGNAVGEATSYQNLAACYQASELTDDALHFYEASVAAFNKVRSQLQDKDEWKISIQNNHQGANKAWWNLLKILGRTAEALLVLERGRAQALEDLMKSKYGLQERRSQEQRINTIDIIHVSSNVFYAAVDDNRINMWYIQESSPVLFRLKNLDDTTLEQTATTSLQSYINLMLEIICPPRDRRCEDRSLNSLRDHTPGTEFRDDAASLLGKSFSDNGARSETPLENFLKTLYEITVSPVADLNVGDELIIVPDGPLFKVPFAALIDSNSRYLCESFRIRLLPSLTALRLILDGPADYHLTKGALIVGDPCVQKIVVNRGRNMVKALHQLPNAKEEAEMVGRILNIKPLIGQEATKDEVLKRVGNVALVHIAAHGNSEAGEIALTPNPSRATEIPEREDYLLTMKEVLNVGLRARLVVLSCCYSGRGEINSEGVVGIARAFLGAGARSVLVSLWAVSDKATKEFMACFYQKLITGKSASEALNQAMNDMRQSPTFGAVKYWAPFVLIGDDVRLEWDKDEKQHSNDDKKTTDVAVAVD